MPITLRPLCIAISLLSGVENGVDLSSHDVTHRVPNAAGRFLCHLYTCWKQGGPVYQLPKAAVSAARDHLVASMAYIEQGTDGQARLVPTCKVSVLGNFRLVSCESQAILSEGVTQKGCSLLIAKAALPARLKIFSRLARVRSEPLWSQSWQHVIRQISFYGTALVSEAGLEKRTIHLLAAPLILTPSAMKTPQLAGS